MLWVKQSTATILKLGPFVDSTDAVTPETGLSIAQADIQISKNGGAFAQTSDASPTTTHDADGWYPIPLTATDTNTLGTIKVQVAMSGALPVWAECMVLPAVAYDSLVAGSDTLDVNITSISGGGAAADALEAVFDGTGSLAAGLGLMESFELFGFVLYHGEIGTVTSQTQFTITGGEESVDDNAYNNALAVIVDSANSKQKAVGLVSDYTGSTQTLFLASDPGIFTIASGDAILLLPLPSSIGSVTGTVGGIAGTIQTLDALDTAQDTQHSTTQGLIGTPSDFGSGTSTIAANLEDIADNGTASYDRSTDSLQALRDRGDAAWTTGAGGSNPWTIASGTIGSTGNDTTHVHLTGLTFGDDEVNGLLLILTDVSESETHSRWIEDWANTGALATVTTLPFTPQDATDTYAIVAVRRDVDATRISGNSTAADNVETCFTGTITTLDALDTAQDTQHSTTQSAVAALNNLSAADVNAEVDSALADYDSPTNAEMVAAFTEIKGTTWSSTTDTLEALRDRGDAAWTTATGFSTLDAAGVRTAVGLASANLDTQLADIPTVAEFNARTLAAADYFDPATDAVANVTTVGTVSALAAGSVDASALASDAVTEIGTAFLATALTKGTAGTIERAFWQILKTQAVVDGAISGTPSASTFNTDLTASDGVYDHQLMLLTSGTLAGEARPIDTYVQTNGVITLQEAFSSAPSSSDEFIILPNHVHPISDIQSGLATSVEIAALNDLSAADVNAQVDTALADIHLDHLFAVDYDPASKPGVSTALLNELIGNDAGVSQFTANALELGPSGSGLDAAGVRAAVGLASANLDSQLSTITADTNELQNDWANGGRLDTILDTAAGASSGGGARTIVVTIDDGTDPLENAIVRMTEGANTYTVTTDASGNGTFNLDDATYTVAIYKSGYTYAGTTLVVTADATPTYSMSALNISAPANPAMTTAYLNVYDIDGSLLANETFTYQQTTAPTGTGTSFEPDSGTATSDANGLLQIAMYKDSYYDITRPSGPTATVEIPSDAGDTYELPNMI